MAYRDLDHAIGLLNRGKGSLVASVITNDGETARALVHGSAAFHGRLYFNNRASMKEATGHGSPCRTWSMAALAVRAAERSWAASGA